MSASYTNIITSRKNRRIIEARKLQQRKYRYRQERFLVEGSQLLQMALDAGIQPIEVFFSDELERDPSAQILLDRFQKANAELVPVSPYVMEALSDRSNTQTIIATFVRFETPFHAIDLRQGNLIVIVDHPQSPPNLGMIFRTADAVGAISVILIQPCVDPLHPMAIRVSLGTLFNLPFVQTQDIAELFIHLHQAGFKTVGADPNIGAWDHDIWSGKIALILGSDVHGLSDDICPYVKDWVRLPMVGKVESLSSAVAGSVLMYEWFRANY